MSDFTFHDARLYVMDAVESAMRAGGDESEAVDRFDLASIVMDLHGKHGTYDLSAIDDDVFWAAVHRHELPDH